MLENMVYTKATKNTSLLPVTTVEHHHPGTINRVSIALRFCDGPAGNGEHMSEMTWTAPVEREENEQGSSNSHTMDLPGLDIRKTVGVPK